MLVATDIASRGIDVDKLTHVINYELPEIPETYVHRIGRTGRAGESGIALSFCGSEEIDNLKDINKLLPQSIEVASTHKFPMGIRNVARPKPGGGGGRGGSRNSGGNSGNSRNSQQSRRRF